MSISKVIAQVQSGPYGCELGDLPVYHTVRSLWVLGELGDLPVYHTARSLWVLGELGDLPVYTTQPGPYGCWVSWETSLSTTQSGPYGCWVSWETSLSTTQPGLSGNENKVKSVRYRCVASKGGLYIGHKPYTLSIYGIYF